MTRAPHLRDKAKEIIEFTGLSALSDGKHDVAASDHADVAMKRFAGMKEDGLSSGAPKSRCNLVGDNSRFADSGNNYLPLRPGQSCGLQPETGPPNCRGRTRRASISMSMTGTPSPLICLSSSFSLYGFPLPYSLPTKRLQSIVIQSGVAKVRDSFPGEFLKREFGFWPGPC